MFEKFLSENIDNFRQRYEGTYGFFRNDQGKRMLVRILAIAPDRCDFVGPGDISFHIRPDVKDNIGFEFLPPKSQWYNTEDGAMYVERVAQRQFSRGITSKNILIYKLDRGTPAPTSVGFKNLGMIFDSGVFAPKKLLTMLGNSKAIAVAPSFAFDPSGYIYLFKEAIGNFTKQKDSHFIIKLAEPDIWKTELTDALTSLGYTSEIA